jgi:hypothetical protein
MSEDYLAYCHRRAGQLGQRVETDDRLTTFLAATQAPLFPLRGLLFCGGYHQRLTQFLVPLELTGIQHWATIDARYEAGPTVVGDVSDVAFLRSLPQAQWDAVFLANCCKTVYNDGKLPTLRRDWVQAVRGLLRVGGEILIRGLLTANLPRLVDLRFELQALRNGEGSATPLVDHYRRVVEEALGTAIKFALTLDGEDVVLVIPQ